MAWDTAVATLAGWLPVGYAFAAGMAASVNPCGFLLLPSYISYHLGTQEDGFDEQTVGRRVLKALLLGGVATAGFVAVITIVGTIITAGGQWLVGVFPLGRVGHRGRDGHPWGVAAGDATGPWASWRRAASRWAGGRSPPSFSFGMALGRVAQLHAADLSRGGGQFTTSQGLANSLAQFVGYALGMGTILVAVTVGAAIFRGTIARWLRMAIPYVHHMSTSCFWSAPGDTWFTIGCSSPGFPFSTA